MRIREIVVGADGTPPGGAAVRWAAREAVRRRARLRVVHAFDWNWRAERPDADCGYAEERHLAEAVTADAERTARAVDPALDVLAVAVPGKPVPCLLDAAEYADLLVVGSRGRTGLIGLVSGSTGRHVITHAPCPVVVVRGRQDAETGPVVAGIDDSAASERVLATAFEAAADRGAGLTVVHAYLPVAPLWGIDVPVTSAAAPGEDAAEHERIAELVGRWRDKFPKVPVEVLIGHGGAAPLLAGVSGGVRLIVVGNRGHGVLAGALLGSTGAYLLHHAECPVWIVRAGPEG